MLDLVVDRREMRAVIANALRFMGAKRSEPAASPSAELTPAGVTAAPRRRRRHERVLHSVFGDRPAFLPLRPRTVRHQVRPREHVRDRRPPRASRADVPIGPHRRHQRQGIGHGDDRRRRCARPVTGPARYTSPHLVDLTERFVIDGRPVAADKLVAAVADVQAADRSSCWPKACCRRIRRFSKSRPPSPSSCSGAPASTWRCSRSASAAGSTRRTSSTPVVTAITSIAFDHQQYLGSTLAEIATGEGRHHQAGRPDGRRGARARGARRDRGHRPGARRSADSRGRGRDGHATRGPARSPFARPRAITARSTMGLQGAHQIGNAVVAVRMLELLDAQGIAVPRRRRRVGARPTLVAGTARSAAAAGWSRDPARRGAQPGRRRRSRVLLAGARRLNACRSSSPACATRISKACCARCCRSSGRSWSPARRIAARPIPKSSLRSRAGSRRTTSVTIAASPVEALDDRLARRRRASSSPDPFFFSVTS